MNTYPNIYMDEAGYTGSHILDANQPYFVLSAVYFTEEELKRLQKDITFDKELHFIEMKRSIKGRHTIKQILEHPLINEDHISFKFIDKRFCIYAQIVDMTIEPVFHFIFREDFYTKRNNIFFANLLYIFCEEHPNHDAIDKFLYSFENMMRKKTKESVEDFYLNVIHISQDSKNEDLINILEYIKLSYKILEHVLIEDNTYCLDTTITSLLCMTNHWSQKLGSMINIITDDSKPIKAGIGMLERLSKIPGGQRLVGYDTRKQIFPLPIHSILTVDSKTTFGVQLADLIASSCAFILGNTTSKYKKFQEELKQIPFCQLKGYPLQPATAEYLNQDVDDSNDSDLLDFIIQHLHD